jgi:hypothetical protein
VLRPKAAQITCFVPSITDRGHVHFVDGADGGYTMAATAMKAREGGRPAPDRFRPPTLRRGARWCTRTRRLGAVWPCL